MYNKILRMDDIPEKLFNVGEKKIFKKNDIIINQGEFINFTYILVKGKLLVYVNTENGCMYYELLLVSPCIFGESYTIKQNEINGSFKCLEDTEVIMVSRKTLLDLMKVNFDINIYIYTITASKLNTQGLLTIQFATMSSKEKIIFFLIELAEKLGIKIDGKIKIDFSISQQFISKFTSVERTSTVKTFNELKDKHILEYHDGFYYINDLDLLKKMVRFSK